MSRIGAPLRQELRWCSRRVVLPNEVEFEATRVARRQVFAQPALPDFRLHRRVRQRHERVERWRFHDAGLVQRDEERIEKLRDNSEDAELDGSSGSVRSGLR